MSDNTIFDTETYLQGLAFNVNDTYSYVNHSAFYSMVSAPYHDYYMRVIRVNQQWLDGYVAGFHDQEKGIFSTRLAASIVNGVGNHICGKKMGFKLIKVTDNHDTIYFMNEWAKKKNSNFFGAVRKAVKFACGLSTSLLKLNKSKDDLWVEALRLDSFLYQTDMRGRLLDLTCIIKGYNDNRPQDTRAKDIYYLVERRYFKTFVRKECVRNGKKTRWIEKSERVPFVSYHIHKYNGQTLNDYGYNFVQHEDMRWDSIPKEIRDAIRNDYGFLEIGKEQRLPFRESLGCELIPCGDCDISAPNLPLGTSVLQYIISELMDYDAAWSWYVRDQYQGKGFVLSPRSFMGEVQQDSAYGNMNHNMVEKIYSEDENARPEKVQFELRAEEWERIQDNILKKIATKLGMSPKTIASYLEESVGQKTDDEIEAETNSTIEFIETMRTTFEEAINSLLDLVTSYYGKLDRVAIRFATPSMVNKDKVIDREIRKLEAQLTTVDDAIHAIYDDDDEIQIHDRVQRILAAQQAQKQEEMMQWQQGDQENDL